MPAQIPMQTEASLTHKNGYSSSMMHFSEPSLAARRFYWRVRVEGSLRLPEYAGSLLRGAFGHALRQIACVTRQPVCTDCPLQSSCAYKYLFETPIPESASVLRRYPVAPTPLVIEAPLNGPPLAAGDHWTFSMVLIGKARLSLPLITLAWQRACGAGLGSRKTPAVLEACRAEDEAQWHAPGEPVPEPASAFSIPPLPEEDLSLRFLTPFRGKQEGKLAGAAQLQFADFFSHLQRRVGLLHTFHGLGGEWDWDYAEALRIAQGIHWEPDHVHWMDWTRYSSRQGREMLLGGVLGAYHLPREGLEPLWPLLYLGQWLHAGKNTSFGLGRYEIVPSGGLHASE